MIWTLTVTVKRTFTNIFFACINLCIINKIRPCGQVGHGQHLIIISTNFVALEATPCAT